MKTRRVFRSLFIASFVACAWPVVAHAQRDTCLTMSAGFTADPAKTLGQVRFEALNTQRSRLLATLGTHVSSTNQMITRSVGDSVFRVSLQNIDQNTEGTITQDSVIDWGTTDGGRTWTLKYYGCAAVVPGASDPRFEVKARLDKTPPTYAWAGPSREERDTIVATVSVSLPSYLTVLSRGEDDSLVVTYPSAAIGQPNRTVLMPVDSMLVPPQGSRVRVIMDPNAQKSHPTMIIIATKRDIPIAPSRPPTNPNGFWKMSWQEYIQWYNKIPLDQKTMVQLPYQIEKVKRR